MAGFLHARVLATQYRSSVSFRPSLAIVTWMNAMLSRQLLGWVVHLRTTSNSRLGARRKRGMNILRANIAITRYSVPHISASYVLRKTILTPRSVSRLGISRLSGKLLQSYTPATH